VQNGVGEGKIAAGVGPDRGSEADQEGELNRDDRREK
jgi:hypothetical protein